MSALKLLIIEDSAIDAEIAVAVLQRNWPDMQWSHVDTAAQFRTALSDNPDVIIADYEVPGFGAVAALNLLRELGSEIPLIVLTGAVSEQTVVQCMRMGAADYLLKDRMTRLASAVTNALGMRQEREAKRRAQRLRELSEQRYRSLFFHHPDAVFSLDLAGCFVSINRRCELLFSCTQQELRGRPFISLLPAAEAPEISRVFGELSAGQPQSFKTYHEKTDASRVELSITTIPIEVEGAVVGIYGIARDITDEVRSRKALEESERQQRQLAELNSAIFNSLPAHIALLDRNGYVVAVNEAWQRFGTAHGFDDPACKTGANYFDVCANAVMRSPHESPQVIDALTQVLDLRRDSFAVEYATRSDHQKRWFRMMITPVAPTADARTAGAHAAVVMHLDVTDRRLAEEQLQINANALRQLTEGVIITDAELRIVTVNDAFTVITGHSAQETLGQPIRDFFAGEYPDSLMQDIRAQVRKAGAWKGELQSRRRNGEAFPAIFSFSAIRSESGEPEHYTAVFTDLTTFRDFEQRIEYLSLHDALTGLPNRAALEDHVRSAIAYAHSTHTQAALLLVELDRFKSVNDSLGHPVGDLLLKAVAHRLEQVRKPDDVLARMGGDEFMLFSLDAHFPLGANELSQRIRAALQQPFVVGEHELFITASIGVSNYPADGCDLESLMRTADAAVYTAKQQGRNTVAFYSAQMNDTTRERFVMQNSLPNALTRGEFILEYQPTIDLRTGLVHGAEALIRWQHPQLGLLSPLTFIGLAEDTGQIIPIGEWVLRESCEQLHRWHAAGWTDATVAVNLSARQFAHPELADDIERVLRETQTDPRRLRLEITESMMMSDPLSAERVVNRLVAQGLQIAIDDFGTGYSSLNYLQRFNVHCLKVDKSFVSGVPGDRGSESIVRAIVALGKTLGMTVVAEGTESLDQVKFLRATGCDQAQGYYYSRPVAADRLLPLARRIPIASAH